MFMDNETEISMYSKDATASFDVDAQKTFTPLCPDQLPVPGGDEIAQSLNTQASFARLRIASKDAHSPKAKWVADEDHPQFSPVIGFPHLDIHWKQHAVPGTDGFDLLDGLPHPGDYDFFVYKGIEPDMHPYGACYHNTNKQSTGVIEFLKCNGIRNVIVGGLATDYCVKNTALELQAAGFQVILNLAACRGIDETTIVPALAAMRAAGVIIVDDVATCGLFGADDSMAEPDAKLPDGLLKPLSYLLTGSTNQ